MPATPEQGKDIIQLKKERLELKAQVQALKQEAYKLQLENDVLKKAAEILKKYQGISLDKLTNSIPAGKVYLSPVVDCFNGCVPP